MLRERGLDSVRRAVAAGVPVALGTDAGVHPHGRNLAELARLVEVGLAPLEALRAGTLGGARLLGLDAALGSVEAGKLADLVVTEVDPLTCASANSRMLPPCGWCFRPVAWSKTSTVGRLARPDPPDHCAD